MKYSKAVLAEIEVTVQQTSAILAGRGAMVQAAVLADLLAGWLAGHFAKDPADNDAMRTVLLEGHIKAVKQLIPINEATILEQVARGEKKVSAP